MSRIKAPLFLPRLRQPPLTLRVRLLMRLFTGSLTSLHSAAHHCSDSPSSLYLLSSFSFSFSLFLSVSVSVSSSLFRPQSPSLPPFVSLLPSIPTSPFSGCGLSTYLSSIYQSTHPSTIYLSINLYHLWACLSVCLSVCLYVSDSICPYSGQQKFIPLRR